MCFFISRYDFKGIIDYIFHSSETMSALGVLGPIDTDWFKDNKVLGCPHPHIPSGIKRVDFCRIGRVHIMLTDF